MNKKGVLIILVVLAVLAVLVIALSGGRRSGVIDEGTAGPGEEEVGTETFDPTIPDKNLELTEPKSQTAAAPGSDASLRIFEMTATRDGYDPEKIVVNEGDTVSIEMQTDGVEYDISLPDMGLYQSVKEGEKKKLEFQVLTPGTFTYLCKDMCPGGKEIKGSLIVKSR